jgi:hypothetical protein
MIRGTIVAALLAGLSCSAAFAAAPGPAYNQAADLAAGKSAGAVYDGSSARSAVEGEVKGALSTGELSVPATTARPASSRDLLTDAVVPAPDKSADKGFFSGKSLKMGGGGAILGAFIGFLLGGPMGALIGAGVGLGLGFATSKFVD